MKTTVAGHGMKYVGGEIQVKSLVFYPDTLATARQGNQDFSNTAQRLKNLLVLVVFAGVRLRGGF